jgi:LmbE family N-acetylglucosaminyl deacetylase
MKVLVYSPHTDDAELGCGGYLAKLKEQGHDITVIAYSYCEDSLPDEIKGALLMEFKISMGTLGVSYKHYDYKVRTFGLYRKEILQSMRDDFRIYRPDLVLIPSFSDIHQDHHVIHAEGVRAFSRECSVLCYELPWNCRTFVPDHYEELNNEHLEKKMNAILSYKSQIDLNRPYFDRELIFGLARARGLQIKRKYAEAFETITMIAP